MTTPTIRLIVRPRWRVNALDLAAPHAVISITDPPPFGTFASIPPGPVAVGRWAFVDVHDPEHPMAMREKHAKGIWRFVAAQMPHVGAFVVSCEAGASRSPSVAMALADGLRLGRGCIDWLGMHAAGAPNTLVYDLMMEHRPK